MYLNALCNRFITADASSCGSASTANAGSTGATVNRMSRYSEWSIPVAAISSTNVVTLRARAAAGRRPAGPQRARGPRARRRLVKLRPSTAPVLPLMGTVPRFSA